MPQLDFTTYPSQILWLVITFGILYFVLARFSLPVIGEVLQNRRTRIASDIKKAEALKEEAGSAAADFTSLLDDAKISASKIMEEINNQIKENENELSEKLEKNFAAQTKESDFRVDILRKESKDKVLPIAAEAAKEIIDNIAGIDVKLSDVEEIVKKISKELEGSNAV